MLLALDLGNTELTIGAFAGDRLVAHWRLTSVECTPDEWAFTITGFLSQAGHSTEEIRAAVLASVAPHTALGLTDGVERATGRHALTVTHASPLPIVLDVDEPSSVGADRIVNVLAAAEQYGRDVVVVDFGTATTFDCVTADRRFIGGVIMPGLWTAGRDLVRRAAKLPATDLVAPPTTIGRRTEECLQAGLLFGSAEAVDGLVRRITAEWPGPADPHVVATGGWASIVAPHCRAVAEVHPTLTLEGLRLAATHLGAIW
jgi:type III pantothenate kinase